MKNIIKSQILFPAAALLTILVFACDSSDSNSGSGPGEQTVTIPAGATDIKITYNEGRVWQGAQIYCIWLESNTDDTIIPILLTGRSLTPIGGIGSSLAYWRLNKKSEIESKVSSTEIDAVTTATPNLPASDSGNEVGKQIAVPIPSSAVTRGRGGFSVTQNIPESLRKFTVYFEIEHSWDANSYFSDQPAILYKAVIDFDKFPADGEVKFVFAGWTPYSTTTVDGVSRPAGVLQTESKYITTAVSGQYPATDMMMNRANVTIVP